MLPTLIAIMSEQSDDDSDDSSASDTGVHHHAKIHKHSPKEKTVANKNSTNSAEPSVPNTGLAIPAAQR